MTLATRRTSPAIPSPWDRAVLCATIERARRRPLLLAAAELPRGQSSLWITADAIDLIVYPDAADEAQLLHAIAHQAAHILLGHQADADDTIPSLFPDLASEFFAATLTTFRFSVGDAMPCG